MKNINSFLAIGILGIIITSLLHILMTLVISGDALQVSFFVIYPIFIAFLLIGFKQLLKEQNKPDESA